MAGTAPPDRRGLCCGASVVGDRWWGYDAFFSHVRTSPFPCGIGGEKKKSRHICPADAPTRARPIVLYAALRYPLHLGQLNDLGISFKTSAGVVHAIRGVNVELRKGETVAIVGEFGSGKSVSMKAAVGLLAGNATCR